MPLSTRVAEVARKREGPSPKSLKKNLWPFLLSPKGCQLLPLYTQCKDFMWRGYLMVLLLSPTSASPSMCFSQIFISCHLSQSGWRKLGSEFSLHSRNCLNWSCMHKKFYKVDFERRGNRFQGFAEIGSDVQCIWQIKENLQEKRC